MAFFAAHEIHTIPLAPQDKRQRLAASLLALTAQGLLLGLLLFGAVHSIVTTPPQPVVVMADLSAKPRPLAPMAPPDPIKVHVAPATALAPEIEIQPEAKPAPVPTPAPAPQTTVATATESAWSTAASGGAPGAGTKTGAASGGGGGGYDINPYLARVAAHIQGYLRLPYMPSGGGQTQAPKVAVHMIWQRDGMVMKAEVSSSSGNDKVDQAAVDAVLRAQPLPPFPTELAGERINGLIPVTFVYRWVTAR